MQVAIRELVGGDWNKACRRDGLLAEFREREAVDKLQIVAEAKRKNSSDVVINEVLSVQETEDLSTAFPEFEIVFTHTLKSSHGYYAASRKLETYLLHKRIQLSEYTEKPDNYGFYCIDVGGVYNSKQAKSCSLHCCAPILDGLDCVRETFRRALDVANVCNGKDATNYMKGERINLMLSCDGTNLPANANYCNNKAQDCNATSLFLIFVHSLYDINPKDVANIFQKKNAITGYATLLFDPIIFLQDEGTFNGVRFEKDVKNNKITFSFVNDSSFVYTHKLSNYLSYFCQTYCVSADGSCGVVIEMAEQRGPVQVMKLTRISSVDSVCSFKRKIWLNGHQQKVLINYYSYDEEHAAVGDLDGSLVKKSIIVDKTLLNHGLSVALRFSEDNFKIANIYNHMTSYNRSIVVGAKEVVSRDTSVDAVTLFHISTIIYVYVYQLKFNNGKVLRQMLKDIETNRELVSDGFLGRFFKHRSDTLTSGSRWFASIQRFFYNLKTMDYVKLENLINAPIEFINIDASKPVQHFIKCKLGIVEFTVPTFQTSEAIDSCRQLLNLMINEQFSEQSDGGDYEPKALIDDLKLTVVVEDHSKRIHMCHSTHNTVTELAVHHKMTVDTRAGQSTIAKFKTSLKGIVDAIFLTNDGVELGNAMSESIAMTAGVFSMIEPTLCYMANEPNIDHLVLGNSDILKNQDQVYATPTTKINNVKAVFLDCEVDLIIDKGGFSAAKPKNFTAALKNFLKFYRSSSLVTHVASISSALDIELLPESSAPTPGQVLVGPPHCKKIPYGAILICACDVVRCGRHYWSDYLGLTGLRVQRYLHLTATRTCIVALSLGGIIPTSILNAMDEALVDLILNDTAPASSDDDEDECKSDSSLPLPVSKVDATVCAIDQTADKHSVSSLLVDSSTNEPINDNKCDRHDVERDDSNLEYVYFTQDDAVREGKFYIFRNKKYILQRANGDGNCLFYALLGVKNAPPEQIIALKTEIWEKGRGLKNQFLNIPDLDRECHGEWGGFAFVFAYSVIKGLNIALWTVNGKYETSFGYGSDNELNRGLIFSGAHYDYLVIAPDTDQSTPVAADDDINDISSPLPVAHDIDQSAPVVVEGVMTDIGRVVSDDCKIGQDIECDVTTTIVGPDNDNVTLQPIDDSIDHVVVDESTAVSVTIQDKGSEHVVYFDKNVTFDDYNIKLLSTLLGDADFVLSPLLLYFFGGKSWDDVAQELQTYFPSLKISDMILTKDRMAVIRRLRANNCVFTICSLANERLSVFDDYLIRCDKYGDTSAVLKQLDNVIVPNRGALKILEILNSDEKFLAAIRKAKRILDLGAAPGGFSTVIRHMNSECELVMVSKTQDKIYEFIRADIVRADITVEFKLDGQFDVIVCDVADDSAWRDQTLYDAAKRIILKYASANATVLIKLSNVTLSYDYAGLKDFRLHKPNFSRDFNSEAYLVANVCAAGEPTTVFPQDDIKSLRAIFVDGLVGALTVAKSDCGDARHPVNVLCDEIGELSGVFSYTDDEKVSGNVTSLYKTISGIIGKAKAVIYGKSRHSLLADISKESADVQDIFLLSYDTTIESNCLYDATKLGPEDLSNILEHLAKSYSESDVMLLVDMQCTKITPYSYIFSLLHSPRFDSLVCLAKTTYVIIRAKLRNRPNAQAYQSSFNVIAKHRQTCLNCKNGILSDEMYEGADGRTIFRCPAEQSSRLISKLIDQEQWGDCDVVFTLEGTNDVQKDGTSNKMGKLSSVHYIIYSYINKKNTKASIAAKKELMRLIKKLKLDPNTCVFGIKLILSDLSILTYVRDYAKKILYEERDPIKELRNVSSLPVVKFTDELYKPDFTFKKCDTAWNDNVCAEYLERLRITNSVVKTKCERSYQKLMKFMKNIKQNTYIETDPEVGLLDVMNKNWLIRPIQCEESYEYGFDGNTFIKINCKRVAPEQRRRSDMSHNFNVDNRDTDSNYILVNTGTRVMNETSIYHSCSVVNKLDWSALSVILVQGVPGCAKTTQIVNAYVSGDLVLTATREGAKDVIVRLLAKGFTVEGLGDDIRTVDSYLISNKTSSHNIVFVDEGFMCHAGALLFAAAKANATTLYVFGDSNQIPFINRLGHIKPLYERVDRLNHQSIVRTHSFRIPADVAHHLNEMRVYPNTVSTSNKCLDSLRVRPYASNQIDKSVVTLCFTRSEKAQLESQGIKRVYTGGEFQGKQADVIQVVRINPKPLSIYDDANQILVMMSRHTQSLTYYTVVITDSFAKLIRKKPNRQRIEKLVTDKKLVDIPKLRGGYLAVSDLQVPERDVFFLPSSHVAFEGQRKKFRDLVQNNNFTNVKSMKIMSIPLKTQMTERLECPQYQSSGDLAILQDFYDVIQPMGSLSDYFDLYFRAELDDVYVTINNVRIDPDKNAVLPVNDKMIPLLRTAILPPVEQTFIQVLKAYTDRNGNPPNLACVVDTDVLVDTVVDRFLATYIDPAQLSYVQMFSEESVELNTDDLEVWYKKQPKQIIDMLEADDLWLRKDLTLYEMILKRNPKPNLDSNYYSKISSPQVIAASFKDMNAVVSPIVNILKNRLIAVMKRQFIMFSDVSIDVFEDILSSRFPVMMLEKYAAYLEIDFSKYDKSQGYFAAELEERLIAILGFPKHLKALWRYCHLITTLWHRSTNFKGTCIYQRKSGDAMTYFGNTLLVMSVIASMYDLSDAYAMFSGDDSFIFFPTGTEIEDKTESFATLFNLEAKLLHYEWPYFCSKFLIPNDNRWYAIPDLTKLLQKLGRMDLVDPIHAEQYRISTADLCKNFSNSLLNNKISNAMNDRYGTKLDYSGLLAALNAILNDAALFLSLYREPNTPEYLRYRNDKNRNRPSLEI